MRFFFSFRIIEDIRVEESRGQSIDLALSIRGREALRLVDLEDTLVNHHGIAMRGRMLHGRDGKLNEMIYDKIGNNVSFSWKHFQLKFSKKILFRFFNYNFSYSVFIRSAGSTWTKFYWMVSVARNIFWYHKITNQSFRVQRLQKHPRNSETAELLSPSCFKVLRFHDANYDSSKFKLLLPG